MFLSRDNYIIPFCAAHVQLMVYGWYHVQLGAM